MYGRVIGSALVVGIAGGLEVVVRSATNIASATVAGAQFDNSNASAVFHDVTQHSISLITGGIPAVAAFIIGMIWIPVLIRLMKESQ